MSTDKIVGFIIAIVVALALTPVVKSSCDDAIQGDLIYYTSATINSGFSDNTGASPDNWIKATTVNRDAAWDDSGFVYSENDNGTAEWYQSLSIGDLHDGVTSATIAAKFRLVDNEALTSFTAQVILDDGTDNNVIWESASQENSASYTSIDNNVIDYIVATGTYTIRLYDSVEVTNDNSVIVRWDDASLRVTTAGYEPLTGAPKIMLQLVPLFYVVGLLGAAIAWVVKSSKK